MSAVEHGFRLRGQEGRDRPGRDWDRDRDRDCERDWERNWGPELRQVMSLRLNGMGLRFEQDTRTRSWDSDQNQAQALNESTPTSTSLPDPT